MADAGTRRVGNVTAGFMLICALLVDGLQFLLTLTVVGSVVAAIISPMVAFVFWLWFALLGVPYLGRGGGKKALIALTASIAELVPFVNALPATTVGIAGIIVQSRLEDKRVAKGKAVTPRTMQAQARLARMRARRAAQTDASATEGAA